MICIKVSLVLIAIHRIWLIFAYFLLRELLATQERFPADSKGSEASYTYVRTPVHLYNILVITFILGFT